MLKYSTYSSIYSNTEGTQDHTLFGKLLHQLIVNNRRFLVRLAIIISVVFLCLTGFMTVFTNASKIVSYQEFVVSTGDSLWSIALEHKPYHMDTREYIERIKQLNVMETSDIQTGQVLSLPHVE
ncbi:cell division suppressor protein YneA [Paenibacillus sp. An7]|uniref:cell division suppressor protein YneA n=1 Tax=Paenibacillus sp. An7 TaxID=2689577 RepID=UPI0013599728|nr:LysM peptidoglycan-binding domain-containing protein [Paenibacillus sp. An7]